MPSIIDAILGLNANARAVVNGQPSNEKEYKANVKYISGADENGNAIYKETQDFTWSQVSTKLTELQTAYDNQQYARNRLASYPSLQEFAEAYCEKEVGGDSTKWDAYVVKYNKVRSDNPKE